MKNSFTAIVILGASLCAAAEDGSTAIPKKEEVGEKPPFESTLPPLPEIYRINIAAPGPYLQEPRRPGRHAALHHPVVPDRFPGPAGEPGPQAPRKDDAPVGNRRIARSQQGQFFAVA